MDEDIHAARFLGGQVFADVETFHFTGDLLAACERLTARGVVFTMPPDTAGPAPMAVFGDTCGNLINLVQAS